jgi:hypothetical protein
MNPLVQRQKATSATMERFRGKTFAWGSVDCAKMVAFHLKRLGRKVPLSKAGQYKTALGAKGALKRLGYASLVEAMDGIGLTRIAPAAALTGDIVSFAADHEIGGLGIVLGNGNMLAFHESQDFPVVMTMNQIDFAWKVI